MHRDIKPANLLLDPGGTVKITDFGIANTIGSVPLTVPGEIIGTPGYLAPERVAGARATSASDLYALGIVAYECLVGVPPFQGTSLEIALAHQNRMLPPLPPSVPSDVAAFVMHLTAKDPAWRPGSAAEVALRACSLRDSLAGEPDRVARPDLVESAPAAGAQERLPRAGRSRRGTVLALATMVLAGVTGLTLTNLTGSSSGSHPVSAPSSPAQSSGHSPAGHSPVTSVAAQPAGPSDTSPASPAAAVRQQSTAGPALGQSAAGNNATTPASHKKGGGPGNGKGNGKGKGHGKA